MLDGRFDPQLARLLTAPPPATEPTVRTPAVRIPDEAVSITARLARLCPLMRRPV